MNYFNFFFKFFLPAQYHRISQNLFLSLHNKSALLKKQHPSLSLQKPRIPFYHQLSTTLSGNSLQNRDNCSLVICETNPNPFFLLCSKTVVFSIFASPLQYLFQDNVLVLFIPIVFHSGSLLKDSQQLTLFTYFLVAFFAVFRNDRP